MTTVLLIIVGFLFASLASDHIGKFATKARLPLITGYLLAGAIVGPFGLAWISKTDVVSLGFVDDVALAFIAFAAGSELYIKEVRSRLRSIAWTTLGLVVSTFTLVTVAVLLIADHVPFMSEMAPGHRLAVALLAGSILVARSPSSAIAIINELRARGPFTKTAMGVTVIMDGVVILMFAICASIAYPLVSGESFKGQFIFHVALDLLISLIIGYLAGKLLQLVVSSEAVAVLKTVLVLIVGFAVFGLSDGLKLWSEHLLPLTISVDPLLACMIAGFVAANSHRHRQAFLEALHLAAPTIYLVFFTLVGASMALDTLGQLWPIALILFTVRLVGITIGATLGSVIARIPPRHTRLAWMAYITQAGVGLALAKEVAVEFPTFGPDLATLIIAVIVINQIVGPPFFKFAIKAVGESHLPGRGEPDEVRDVVIVGIDDQSLAVALQIEDHGWTVTVADLDISHVTPLHLTHFQARHLERIDEQSLTGIITKSTNAVVAMTGDDDANLRVCQIASERCGVPRIIVRLNHTFRAKEFEEIGALVVEPTSAMVNLLDQFVRVPQLANMLMHRDPDHEVIQITIADPDVDGMPLRELRLPYGVRVLGVARLGHPITPQGNTVLHRNDEVTLIGKRSKLDEVANRWGF